MDDEALIAQAVAALEGERRRVLQRLVEAPELAEALMIDLAGIDSALARLRGQGRARPARAPRRRSRPPVWTETP